MDDEITRVSIPVEPAGIQCLSRGVHTSIGENLLRIHTGIPVNQVRSIVYNVVEETLVQLVSAQQARDSE